MMDEEYEKYSEEPSEDEEDYEMTDYKENEKV